MADQPVQLLIYEFNEFKELLYKVNPANTFIPELTRISILMSFASTALTVVDKASDGTSVVTSIMAGDITTGLLTLIFMYLSGLASIFIWMAPGHVMDICARLPETWKAIRYRLCCSCCGGRKRWVLFNCGCVTCHRPFVWLVILCCLVLSPLSTPILFIIYFVRQVRLYRKCEKGKDIKDKETKSYRVITEVVSQATITECFFESAPQALLQMYVLATHFERIHDDQQKLRFLVTIVVMISSMLELGLTVGGRWVDNLGAHPVMELRPDFMKFVLYMEAISFLLVRSTLICGIILVLRALLHSGFLATLTALAFLLIPRIIAMIVRILTRMTDVVRGEGMGDYVGQLVSQIVATLLFYPVLQYHWTIIYIECETVFLGLCGIFAYYGEYGVKAEIELFNGVQNGVGRGLIYAICFLYILNIALRWTRVIYLLRLNNTIPEDTVFTVYKYCQSITNTLDDFETKREETEAKKFKLRQLNCELGNLVKYFENNFGEILIEAGQQQLCLCQYSKYLNRLFLNEIQRRGNSIAEFRPAENQGVCQLGDTLLYAEMIDLTLLRLHTFAVFGAGDGDKVEICRGSKWAVYRDLLGKLLCNWKLVHMPRCPEQFLSRCPTFKFLDFKLLLNMSKAKQLFGRVEAPYILWNLKLGRCSECGEMEHASGPGLTVLENNVIC